MFESSPLMILVIAWAVVTAIYFALVYVRSLLALKENDTLILSAGEAKMEVEQQQVRHRIERLNPYTQASGWASVGLAVAAAGLWTYSVLKDLFK